MHRTTLSNLMLALFASAVVVSPHSAGAARHQPETPAEEGGGSPSVPEAGTPDDLECIIVLRDGRRVEGLLVSRDATRTVIRIGDVYNTFQADDIDRMDLLEPISVRYQRMRQAIADDDSEQILMLVEWLLGKRRYAAALTEVLGVLERDPGNARAEEFRRLLEAQMAMMGERAVPERAEPAIRGERTEFPLLTPEQINLIKVFEIDLRRPPRMLVPREVVDHVIRDHAQSELVPTTPEGREALYTRRPEQILELLFQLRARELYDEVQVLEQPEAMRRFRDDVHTQWLMRSCATTRCHGGEEAGRLWLYNRQPNSDATVYTNFLILERFRTVDGQPLINYQEPALSPLLQMALPTEDSLTPHPPIVADGRERAWKPIIRSQNDPMFRRALAWIRAMYRPRTEYPIDYSPPLPGGESPPPAASPR